MPNGIAPGTLRVADLLPAGPGPLTPEAKSLLDTVIKSVLDWATYQRGSNRDSNSLGGILIPSGPSPVFDYVVAGEAWSIDH